MRNRITSLLLFVATLLSCMTITGYAEGFTDMPDDWSTAALTAAVENGLLNGSGGKILPKDNLTRAQMATIIVRALNGQSTTALTDFSDVPADAWYHEYMQKAVYMEVFKGDGTGLLKPDDNITREQVFAVIARAFKLEGADASVLDTFGDKADNSEWAIPTTASMVENGYIKGSGGALNPKAYITRAEFAQIMHNIVKTYIDEPQTLKGNYEGNVIIRCSGVTIASDAVISGNIVVCEGSKDIVFQAGCKAEGIIDNRIQKNPQQQENKENTMQDNNTDIVVKDNNPLSNTYRALKYDKKLTVGYLGGSITFGSSAITDITDQNGNVLKGDISLSYANRTTKWFEEQFPDAVIEHINAGISDTATNYGNYRLEKNLMNRNGHDLPDIVFVEFTVNDWTYDDCAGKQGHEDFVRQAESLVHNIYAINPYCDIVFVFSARNDYSSRPAYVEVAEHYGIQYIDMGIPMQKLMTERGAANETSGNFYYTVDNLHPSFLGYEVYFEQIRNVLEQKLCDQTVEGSQKVNRLTSAPEYINERLWLNPKLLCASDLEIIGTARKFTPCTSYMYGLSKDKMSETNITEDSLIIKSSDTKIRFKFTGTTFSGIFFIKKCGINMDYTIDGGPTKNFTIDKNSHLAFQMSDHTQLFVIEQDLPYGEHEVELSFNPTSVGDVNIRLGAIACSGAQVK